MSETNGMRPKEAVEFLGYRFAHPELDGWAVAYEYQQTVRAGKPIPERLLAYDRDDVLALRFMVRAVERLASS